MKRGLTGRYQITKTGEEQVHAFIPHALPPEPALVIDGPLQQALEAASIALGRLDGVRNLLPDPGHLLYFLVRKEALLSSQIEGTQSSFSDLLFFELGEISRAPRDEVVEVANYVAALTHGLRRLRDDDFPLCNRLLREIHEKLLSSGRGSDKNPGEFRRSQNWIGGSRPGNARFVPPPHAEVQDCMAALERFLHARDDGLPLLIRAALAHVQFETIHPFLDGNGRVGRLLITLLLCESGVLSEPLLYLSLYLKQHRDRYYELLQEARLSGDWEAWLDFFLQGLRETAENAVATANELLQLFATDRARIEVKGRSASSILRVHEALKKRLIISITEASNSAGLNFATVARGFKTLVEMGIAREYTGKQRNRLYVYDRFLALLNKGTEPL